MGGSSAGATEDSFTSPAGAMTLLLAAGWTDRMTLLDALETSRSNGLADVVDCRDDAAVPDPGLRLVSTTLRRWLNEHPDGPLNPGPAATEAIAALVCAWSSALTHALADGPRTATDLVREVTALYGEEMVRDHLEALIRSAQVEELLGDGTEEPRYALTDWGMKAIAPLIAAAHHEAHCPSEDVLMPEVLDVEAAFQLTAPLLRLPTGLRGSCRLGVRISDEEETLLAGTTMDVANGRVVSSSILLEQDPDTWATGTPVMWCDAVVDPTTAARLDVGGDIELARSLLTALHDRLFGRLA